MRYRRIGNYKLFFICDFGSFLYKSLKTRCDQVNLAAWLCSAHVFTNVLVMKNMLEIHFSKCECPSGYNGDPHVFCQCSGHEEHVWNPFFRMWHQILLQNSWISREETPDMDTLKLRKYCRRSQKCPFLKIKCFLWITPPWRYGLA